jgi:RNA polymerase-binding transcription factor DksA
MQLRHKTLRTLAQVACPLLLPYIAGRLLEQRIVPNSFLACEENPMDEYRELRQRLLSRLARLEGRLDKVEKDRRRGSNALEPDWEEQATVRQNDEVLDELAEEERLQAIAIRAALQRLEDGTYGRCVTCAEPIVPQRLEALPYATQCIACATQTEQRGRTGR